MVKTDGEIHYSVRYVLVESAKYEYHLSVSIYFRETVLHMCGVKAIVLNESELLEDMCKSYGLFIYNLGINQSFDVKMKFELTEIKIV